MRHPDPGAGVALAVAELLAGLDPRWRSPVLDVGDRVIDAAPPFVKEFAVETFGTNDKPALLVGMGVLLGLHAAVIGVVALRHRLALGIAGVSLFGAVGMWAAPTAGPRRRGTSCCRASVARSPPQAHWCCCTGRCSSTDRGAMRWSPSRMRAGASSSAERERSSPPCQSVAPRLPRWAAAWVRDDGRVAVHAPDAALAGADQWAITEEPAGGTDVPTGPVLNATA